MTKWFRWKLLGSGRLVYAGNRKWTPTPKEWRMSALSESDFSRKDGDRLLWQPVRSLVVDQVIELAKLPAKD